MKNSKITVLLYYINSDGYVTFIKQYVFEFRTYSQK